MKLLPHHTSGPGADEPLGVRVRRLNRLILLVAAGLLLVGLRRPLAPTPAADAGPTAEPPAPAAESGAAAEDTPDDDAPPAPPPATPVRWGAYAVPAYRQADLVAVLPVEGVIDRYTLLSLEDRIETAVKDGAGAIVLEIDTPGGEMLATLDICHLLKNDAPANTVAWINPMAFSAGTYMALACREIVTDPSATMGDAAPVIPGIALPATERAKAEMPLLAEVKDSARRRGYDENLVQAFVRVGNELWLLEHETTGERIFVTREEYENAFGAAPPVQLPSYQPAPMSNDAAPPVSPLLDRLFNPAPGGPGGPGGGGSSAGPLDPAVLEQSIEDSQALPPSRDPLTSAEASSWRLVAQVVGPADLLTLSANEARAFGLSEAMIASDAELERFFGAKSVRRYEESWSLPLVRFLVSWPVRGLLTVIFLICLFVELAAPGVGAFGAGALVAFALLFGAPWLAGLADWWEILLVIVGILLIGTELLVLPGFGVAGAAGIGCLLVGMVGTFVGDDVTSSVGQQSLWTGLATTLGALLVAMAGIYLVTRHLDTIPLLNRIVLKTELGPLAMPRSASSSGGGGLLSAMGGTAATDAVDIGATGVAVTDLRPSGRARFGERIVDVQSVSGFLDPGAPVRVTALTTFAIEVEAATDAEDDVA